MESQATTLLRGGSSCFRLHPWVVMTQRIRGMVSKVRHGAGQLEGLSNAQVEVEAAGYLRISRLLI